METSIKKQESVKGCDFLLNETKEGQTYTPSQFTEEHRMIKQTVDEFVSERIFPNADRIEKQEQGLSSSLMEEIGTLGILSAHIPEAYGGMQMDFISSSLIAEGMGTAGSFSVSYNAHTGIGMLPILYFGTEEQKTNYLPDLCTGKIKASYCLTEPSSGSDALAAKTRADLSEDGKNYILNGQKMWISNAGFADLFIVFAKIDGEKFTGFIVSKDTPGLSLGAEEDKLGIKGSSTRQVFFENALVPIENILGEIGKGHLIAFNVLNIGRYKLGVSCLGGAKNLSTLSVQYANERNQFNQPISNFGAIKHKLAEQAIRIYTLESSSYRIAGWMDDYVKKSVEEGASYGDSKRIAADEFALECSIIKILGSEVLDYVVDEAVQIYGGMGYSEEGLISRAYRDSRINRIFEGTNEINRLLILNLIFKRAMRGKLDIVSKASEVQSELTQGKQTQEGSIEYKFAEERNTLSGFKKILFMLLGYAGQKALNKSLELKTAQEPLMNLSDIVTDIFTAESVLLRVERPEASPTEISMMKVLFQDTAFRVYKNAFEVTGSIVDENMYGAFISGIKKLSKYPIQNTMMHRREIADQLIAENQYCY